MEVQSVFIACVQERSLDPLWTLASARGQEMLLCDQARLHLGCCAGEGFSSSQPCYSSTAPALPPPPVWSPSPGFRFWELSSPAASTTVRVQELCSAPIRHGAAEKKSSLPPRSRGSFSSQCRELDSFYDFHLSVTKAQDFKTLIKMGIPLKFKDLKSVKNRAASTPMLLTWLSKQLATSLHTKSGGLVRNL